MADTLDLITLAEAKAAVNIATSDTTQDTELAGYITAISRRLDTLCGPIVVRRYTDEEHMTSGDLYLEVRNPPVYAVQSVVEYDTTGAHTHLTEETATTKPAAAWYLDPSTAVKFRVLRRDTGLPYTFPYGGMVRIEYDAGRYATTATVDPVFKQAAAIMLSHLWRREQGVGSSTFGLAADGMAGGVPTFAVPRAVIELLAEHIRPMGIA